MSYYPFSFEAEIVRHNVGRYRYTVVFLPDAMVADMPFDRHARPRISGEVADVPFSGAWQPVRGRWYLMLSKPLLRDAGIVIGDTVEVRFRLEDQGSVAVPAILEDAVAGDRALQDIWATTTAGQKRGFAHHIGSAKTEPTRRKRLDEVVESMKTGRSLRDVLRSRRLR
ncbi:YdeI/OmpD-associated family protein [Bauldia sp.]|uniref:YdeI/OmpD-associated family protein n=1 Tax=Bauldia sp. TaxID=2575872 RepID=UPI003BAB4E7D